MKKPQYKTEPNRMFCDIQDRCVWCSAPNIETKSERTGNPVCLPCSVKHNVEIKINANK